MEKAGALYQFNTCMESILATTNGESRSTFEEIATVRSSTLVMIGFAVLFGLLAVFVAQSWLNSQADARLKSLEAQQKHPAVATQTIVVASKPLRFGIELSAQVLHEIPWAEDALPAGAFAKIGDVLTGGKRVVLAAIEANEPILAVKITGPGQRATLSALLHEGMKAVTIRVSDVEGVAGFVLPGDRVDVALTRLDGKGGATTDVVLQNATVLAIDQIADERAASVVGRQIGDARGRYRRGAEARSRRFARQPVAAAAQSRRDDFAEIAARLAQGSVRRRGHRHGHARPRPRPSRSSAAAGEGGLQRAGRTQGTARSGGSAIGAKLREQGFEKKLREQALRGQVRHSFGNGS